MNSSNRSNIDDLEQKFRKFMLKLLDAQSYNFRDERALFSRHTLKDTLTKFCNIIAENIGADSCTVHLKLYDPNMLGEGELQELRDEVLYAANLKESDRLANSAGGRKPDRPGARGTDELTHGENQEIPNNGESPDAVHSREEGISKKTRRKWMIHPMTFPYWYYPKGAAVLVAANEKIPDTNFKSPSPWLSLMTKANWKLCIGELRKGIVTDIFQGNVARIRDRLSIRRTRHFRKLGVCDQIVWHNSDLLYSFRNFYGAPIRIHSGGEVIGLLKVENKSLGDLSKDLKDLLELHTNQIKEIKYKIFAINYAGMKKKWHLESFPDDDQKKSNLSYCKVYNIEHLDFSFFSLVYLLMDFENWSCKRAIKDGLLIPFPGKNPNLKNKNTELLYESLVCKEKRFPVQIYTTSLKDERELILGLFGSELKWPLSFEVLYHKVKNFYDKILETIPEKAYCPELKLKPEVTKGIIEKIKNLFPKDTAVEARETPEIIQGEKTPLSFNMQLEIQFKNQLTVELHLFIPPTRQEIEKVARLKEYQLTNGFWLSDGRIPNLWIQFWESQEVRKDAFGEIIQVTSYSDNGLDGWEKSQKTIHVTDLALDRLAARVQAFWFALSIPEFSIEETRKVSWAAYEIGKLVEREISYRAGHHPDPIPLTAMEFTRIPISDLNFVDDLRERRGALNIVANEVRARIKRAVYSNKMETAVEFSSRVKSYRSALHRIGERYEGYIRGNLAVWVYLLAILLEYKVERKKEKGEAQSVFGNSAPDAIRKFRCSLKGFRESVEEELCKRIFKSKPKFKSMPEEEIKADLETIKAYFIENHSRIIGDLKFETPPFFCQSRDILTKAWDRICNNLIDENFLSLEELVNASVLREKSTLNMREVLRETLLEESTNGEYYEKHSEGHQSLYQQLHEILFRNYDKFARMSFSLFSQLTNQLRDSGDNERSFIDFYEFCYSLRNNLKVTQRDIEDHKKYWGLRQIFEFDKETDWKEIFEFIDSHSTRDFLKMLSGWPAPKYLYLDEAGIYKRLRSLHHTLRHQSSAASLDWELGRFDLFGSHLNCLYKNQVFALYETLWNMGDPFKFEDEKQMGRLPWLCIKTRVQQDHYNALQIAALVDPSLGDIEEDSNLYTLKRLQSYLFKSFGDFHGPQRKKYQNLEVFRHKVKSEYCDWSKLALAVNRHQDFPKPRHAAIRFGTYLFSGVLDLLLMYLNKHLQGKMDRANDERFKRDENASLQGGMAISPMVGNQKDLKSPLEIFFGLLALIPGIYKFGQVYSDRLLETENKKLECPLEDQQNLNGQDPHGPSQSGDCTSTAWFGPGGWRKIYESARNFAISLKDIWNDSGEHDMLDSIQNELIEEEKLFARNSCKSVTTPIFFVTNWGSGESTNLPGQKEFGLPDRFQEADVWKDFEYILDSYVPKEDAGNKGKMGKGLIPENQQKVQDASSGSDRGDQEKKKSLSKQDAHVFRTVIERLRREQKAYLFYKGDIQSKGFKSLMLRSREEVLDRIQNYILLFNPRKDDPARQNQANWTTLESATKDWTAYDLFYYVRSLVPIEIQVRTQLADTVAEQYHGPIYKGKPPAGTELPRSMMEEVGRRLNEIDMEMEIDYEDYVNDYYWHSKHKTGKS